MQEAWLLIEEAAIRWAAGNKNGKMPLRLPRMRDLEDLPDPKEVLHELLREASGLKGHRRQGVDVSKCSRRVPDFITEFAQLRQLSAFRQLEADIQSVLATEV